MKSTNDTIQPKYQPDPESLVDSIAFGPVSKVEAWDKKLQIMKDHTPASCDKARELYKGVASGIQGKRRWKSPSRRMDAAKALMLSDKLQWIPKKCNPKDKKRKSRTKRHAKSHKMKRKHKQKSKHKQPSKHKHTRRVNRKTNNRRKTRRRNTRRRNIRRTKKRMMGGEAPGINESSPENYITGTLHKNKGLRRWDPRKVTINRDGVMKTEGGGSNKQYNLREYYHPEGFNNTLFGWYSFKLKKSAATHELEFAVDNDNDRQQWITAIKKFTTPRPLVATAEPELQLEPEPAAAEPAAAGAAAPAPADVEAELAAAAAEEAGKAAYKKAAANPNFLFSSPAKPTTPNEYMHAIAKQINEDFKRLCDDYNTLKSNLNSILGQFTSVEGQAKSAMENFSSGRYAKMPARVFGKGWRSKDESNMTKIYEWKRENPKFLGLAPSVNACDDDDAMEMIVGEGKNGTFIDLCMEEIERINKHRFLSPYFGENVKILHEFGAERGRMPDALTFEDVELFQNMEFRVVCFDILKELGLGSHTPQKVEDLINRFKTNKVLITEGGDNDKLKEEVLSRFPDMEKLSGYYGDDYRRQGVESEVAEVVNGPEFNKMVTKLSLLNHLNIMDDGEYELLKNNMSELIAKIDEAKLAASGPPSSGGF